MGFKIFQGRPEKEDFAHVMEKVESKLASWKGKLLNKPIRVTLAKLVLASTPAYGMQLMWYHQYVCDYLDKCTRSFIWKGNMERGLHMISWVDVTKPTKWGGLGIRRARQQNTAYLGKLLWEVVQDSDKLWVQLLRGKYVKEKHSFSAFQRKGSSIWNSIRKCFTSLQSGFSFKIGIGNTSLWFTPWLTTMPLSLLVPFVDIHDVDLCISDLWRDDTWQLHMLYTQLPLEVIDANVQFFLWQLCHLSILARAVLGERGLQLSVECPVCNNGDEFILHCLFMCTIASQLWCRLGLSNIHPAEISRVALMEW